MRKLAEKALALFAAYDRTLAATEIRDALCILLKAIADGVFVDGDKATQAIRASEESRRIAAETFGDRFKEIEGKLAEERIKANAWFKEATHWEARALEAEAANAHTSPEEVT